MYAETGIILEVSRGPRGGRGSSTSEEEMDAEDLRVEPGGPGIQHEASEFMHSVFFLFSGRHGFFTTDGRKRSPPLLFISKMLGEALRV
mmetsp:Transcript_108967/g.281626  ORF Transcript_108967/g.281626 Transcript_108967/m.281626 type:complete len:89 (-) Transcript_108967:144-410(-)